jgi:hypothetical protein
MAPKAKASAPAHLVITGKLKGPPKIFRDGSAVIVKKTLGDGATVEGKIPKRRVRGKQKQLQQVTPAEDVLRTIEEATATVAAAAHAEVKRKLKGLHDLANQVTDQKQREIDVLQHNYRMTVQTGGRLINEIQRKADKQTRRAAKAVVAARAQLKKATERERQPEFFASTITRHMNSGGAPRRTTCRVPGGAQIVDASSDE